ncbi:MAG: hypothetical protein CME68_04025 [Halobacteriovoraceae bacterium]|nr:hypothetical protein [Halobacteriovoraceae bacterium]
MKKFHPIPFFLLSTSMFFFSCGKQDLKMKEPHFSNSSFVTKIRDLNLKRDFRGVYRGSESSKEDNFLRGWQHWDNERFAKVHIPSSNIQSAQKILKSEKMTEVIVAVIDSGIDIDHAAFKDRIWENKNEIPYDGIDNDENGYIDDIHGWNFLGEVEKENLELTRKYRRCMNDGLLEGESRQDCFRVEKEFNKKHKKALQNFNYVSTYSNYFGKEAYNHYYNQVAFHFNPDYNPRKQSIDGLLYDENWGNSNVLPRRDEESHGTHVAGIIAGRKLKDISIGVNPYAKIMALRVVPEGDERAKDVSRAVVYAVDNGARIINMSFGNYENTGQKELLEAFEYASEKGVLIVHAAGNDSLNINKIIHSPSRKGGSEKLINSWIEVGSSTSTIYLNKRDQNYYVNSSLLPSSFSNYGGNYVDIFAPGSQIYAPVPSGKYASMSGTSMASPLVSGVASLLLSYRPELNAVDLKEILLESSRKESYDVNLPLRDQSNRLKAVPFGSLSRTGAVLDAYNAVKYIKERL